MPLYNPITKILETSGPTVLPVGAVPDKDFLARVGNAIVGRSVLVARILGSTSSVTGTALTTILTVPFAKAGDYAFVMLAHQNSSLATAAVQLAMNFTGTGTLTSLHITIADSATTIASVLTGAFGAKVFSAGKAVTSPGLLNIFGSVSCTTPGDLQLQMSSEVAGQTATLRSRAPMFIVEM